MYSTCRVWGALVFQAITQRDLIVVEGVVIILVATEIAVNVFVDLSWTPLSTRVCGAASEPQIQKSDRQQVISDWSDHHAYRRIYGWA